MKGREKCSRSGTVKVTRVTSNLSGYHGVTTRVCLHVGHVSPAGGDHGGGEHAGQPGAREAPGQQVKAAEVDTLQAEHRSRVM